MRPRIDLDAMDVDTPPDEMLGTVAMAGFSRLPVYEGDLDHIIGFVHIKDLLRQLHLGWRLELRKLMHPALFVPESMRLDRLLELFQEKQNQLAIVLNEYGGTEGMVTLEDVMEEIVGEIRDEHRRAEEQEFVRRDDGSWLIDGGAAIDELVERLDLAEDQALAEQRLQHARRPDHGPTRADRRHRRRGRLERPASWRSSTWTAGESTGFWPPRGRFPEPLSSDSRATLTNAQVGPLDPANLAGRDSASTRTPPCAGRMHALRIGSLLLE